MKDVSVEDSFVLSIERTLRTAMEDVVEDVEETSLPKKLKTKLRRAEKETEALMVDIAEVYSPPRIAEAAEGQRMKKGGSYDLMTGFDLRRTEDLKRMWDELVRDDPELVVCCPPCTPFCMLQQWNYPRMDEERAKVMVEEGLHYLKVSADVALWQHHRGRSFLFEHPLGSKAWEEPGIQELMELEGVHVCVLDQCAYGQCVDGGLPNKKPTMCLTDSPRIAAELKRRCDGSHQHQHLLGGRAKLAAVYPPGQWFEVFELI